MWCPFCLYHLVSWCQLCFLKAWIRDVSWSPDQSVAQKGHTVDSNSLKRKHARSLVGMLFMFMTFQLIAPFGSVWKVWFDGVLLATHCSGMFWICLNSLYMSFSSLPKPFRILSVFQSSNLVCQGNLCSQLVPTGWSSHGRLDAVCKKSAIFLRCNSLPNIHEVWTSLALAILDAFRCRIFSAFCWCWPVAVMATLDVNPCKSSLWVSYRKFKVCSSTPWFLEQF